MNKVPEDLHDDHMMTGATVLYGCWGLTIVLALAIGAFVAWVFLSA